MVNHQDIRRRPAGRGALLIAVLLAIGLTIFFSDAIVESTRGTIEVHAVFPEAPGLKPGAEDLFGGYPVGIVKRVGFLPPSADTLARILATIEMPIRYREQLRRDSRVRLASPSPIGDPVLDILPGTPASPPLGDGDTLRAVLSDQAADIRERAAELRRDIDALAADAAGIERAVQARRPAMRRATRAAEAARVEMDHLSADLERSPLAGLLREPGGRAEIARIGERARAVSVLVQQRIDELTGEDDASVRTALASLSARADTLMLRVAELQQTMESRGGFPARFAQDSALLVAIRRVREELDSVVAATRRNPLRYFF
jgi:hypothetical protein